MVSEEKDKHLANVTLFLSKVKSTIVTDELEAVDIQKIRIWDEYVTKPYSGFKLNCSFFHKEGYFVGNNHQVYESEVVGNIVKLFSILDGYNASLVSYELSTKSGITIELNDDLEKKLLDLLLSEELKKLLDYRNLHSELTAQTSISPKRSKI